MPTWRIDSLQVFHRGDLREAVVPDQIVVVARRLDFQIIVIGGNLLQFFVRSAGQDGPVQFPCRAGRAHDDAFPVLVQQALGQPGPLGFAPEILQMGQGDDAVQVPHAFRVLGQQDDVVILLIFFGMAQVAFHAVDELQAVVLALVLQFLQFLIGKGEGLDHAVVRNGQSLVAPAGCRIYHVFHGRKSIHLAHLRMEVEFHPLDLSLILPFVGRFQHDALYGHHDHFHVFVLVHHHIALGLDTGAYRNVLHEVGTFFLVLGQIVVFIAVSEAQLQHHAVRIIRHQDGQHDRIGPQIPLAEAHHSAFDDDAIFFFLDFQYRTRCLRDLTAVYHAVGLHAPVMLCVQGFQSLQVFLALVHLFCPCSGSFFRNRFRFLRQRHNIFQAGSCQTIRVDIDEGDLGNRTGSGKLFGHRCQFLLLQNRSLCSIRDFPGIALFVDFHIGQRKLLYTCCLFRRQIQSGQEVQEHGLVRNQSIFTRAHTYLLLFQQ